MRRLPRVVLHVFDDLVVARRRQVRPGGKYRGPVGLCHALTLRRSMYMLWKSPTMAALPTRLMTYATKRQKRTLLVLQNFRCALCDQEIEGRFECDHVVPKSRGGGSSTAELQALCISCHKEKTNLDGSRRPISSCAKASSKSLTCSATVNRHLGKMAS